MLLSFEGELDFKEDQEEQSTTKENVNHFQEEDDAITLGGYRMLICNVKFFNLHQETLDELCHFSSQKNKRETVNGKNARPDFPDALSKETKKRKH